MRLFRRMPVALAAVCFALGACKTVSPTSEGRGMTVHLKLSDGGYGATGETYQLYGVEDAVESAISSFGTVDGHEIGGGYFVIFITTSNPTDLLSKVEASIDKTSIRSGSYVEFILPDGTTRRTAIRN